MTGCSATIFYVKIRLKCFCFTMVCSHIFDIVDIFWNNDIDFMLFHIKCYVLGNSMGVSNTDFLKAKCNKFLVL